MPRHVLMNVRPEVVPGPACSTPMLFFRLHEPNSSYTMNVGRPARPVSVVVAMPSRMPPVDRLLYQHGLRSTSSRMNRGRRLIVTSSLPNRVLGFSAPSGQLCPSYVSTKSSAMDTNTPR